ncbi:hypothetical protein BDV12DRAFT_28736 [Aspergillus spectabilis]
MAHLTLNPSLLSTLKDKVVVLTGGATGIGRSAATLFHEHGAKIVFGDIAPEPAQELVSALKTNIHFVPCDTASYPSQLTLFRTAHSLHGRIDIVVAVAGVANPKSIFAADADINEEPSMLEIEVNTIGSIYTARIGMHYLRQNGKEGGDIVLMSSIIGFKETEDLVPYTTSKHGVVGIMRGLHLQAEREGISVNVVCPWVTKTRMIVGIEKAWIEGGYPINEPEDVARTIVVCATANRGSEGVTHGGANLPFSGKMIYVSGGEGYEIEDAQKALEPQWLGEENSRILARGQEFLARADVSWDPEKSK